MDAFTYELLEGGRAIRCRTCLSISYHPQDIRELYCGKCGRFHDNPTQQEAAMADQPIPDEAIQLPDENIPLPAELQTLADVVLMQAREHLVKSDILVPRFFMFNRQDKVYEMFPVEMEDAAAKDESAKVMRYAAAHFKADAVFLLSEIWGMPAALKNATKEEVMAAYAKYGSMEAMPGRTDQLMISVEAVEGKWVGLGELTGKGLDRRCPVMEFASLVGHDGDGRFDNLLDMPERRTKRNAVLEKFAAKMQAAGLDPHAPRPDAPDGAYGTLEHILCAHPSAEMPDRVIDMFVATLVLAAKAGVHG